MREKCRTAFVAVMILVVLYGVYYLVSTPLIPLAMFDARLQNQIEEAVSAAAVEYCSESDDQGLTTIEAHIVLGTEEKAERLTVYAVTSYGGFERKNGVFTQISGSASIPTVMVFSRSKSAELALSEYREAEDGDNCAPSVRRMFPSPLWGKLYNAEQYVGMLEEQMKANAAAYIKGAGKSAEVRIL